MGYKYSKECEYCGKEINIGQECMRSFKKDRLSTCCSEARRRRSINISREVFGNKKYCCLSCCILAKVERVKGLFKRKK